MIILFIILWLLIGFLSHAFVENAWRVYWYKKFDEHYIDYKRYSFREEFIFSFVFSLGGLVSFLVLGIAEAFHSKSEYYFPNSLWMVFYNKKKVEKYYGRRN